jgi:glutamate--cysteine ligase
MSLPIEPGAGHHDDPGEPLAGIDTLIGFFSSSAKRQSEFRVGTEHEKFGILRATHAPLPYEGPQGIETILNAIVTATRPGEPDWTPVSEDGRTVGLYCNDGSAITLEPGGQIELSGTPVRTIHETRREVDHHLELLRRVCLPLGVGFIGIGFHPTARWADMPVIPRARYKLLEQHLKRAGQRGLDMMKRTCTIQANLDYADEADMVASFRAALAVSPLVSALFANGAFKEGIPSGVASERLLTWFDTDPVRCGYPDVVFEDGFGFERWVEHVLDVPMLFVRRNGVHHDAAGATFRQFLNRGLGEFRATLRDFTDHLTTVYTEVRLKGYLEVRGADCGPWSRLCALPALWKGVLYDRAARDAALTLMDAPTAAELAALQRAVARYGFAARYRGRPVLELARVLIGIADAGLARQDCRNADGEDERCFLKPLHELLDEGVTFGERLLRFYNTSWEGSIEPLWREIEFFEQQKPTPREADPLTTYAPAR